MIREFRSGRCRFAASARARGPERREAPCTCVEASATHPLPPPPLAIIYTECPQTPPSPIHLAIFLAISCSLKHFSFARLFYLAPVLAPISHHDFPFCLHSFQPSRLVESSISLTPPSESSALRGGVAYPLKAGDYHAPSRHSFVRQQKPPRPLPCHIATTPARQPSSSQGNQTTHRRPFVVFVALNAFILQSSGKNKTFFYDH